MEFSAYATSSTPIQLKAEYILQRQKNRRGDRKLRDIASNPNLKNGKKSCRFLLNNRIF